MTWSVAGGGRHPLCAVLPEDVRKKLCRYARVFEVEEGRAIHVSDFSNEIVLMREGLALGGMYCKDEESSIVATVQRSGDVINIVSLQAHRRGRAPHWNGRHWGIAAVGVVGCAVPSMLADQLVDEYHSFAAALLVIALEKYSESIENTVFLSRASAIERIAWLDALLREEGSSIFDMPHSRIGRIVGLNRVSVTRAMAEYTAAV